MMPFKPGVGPDNDAIIKRGLITLLYYIIISEITQAVAMWVVSECFCCCCFFGGKSGFCFFSWNTTVCTATVYWLTGFYFSFIYIKENQLSLWAECITVKSLCCFSCVLLSLLSIYKQWWVVTHCRHEDLQTVVWNWSILRVWSHTNPDMVW